MIDIEFMLFSSEQEEGGEAGGVRDGSLRHLLAPYSGISYSRIKLTIPPTGPLACLHIHKCIWCIVWESALDNPDPDKKSIESDINLC